MSILFIIWLVFLFVEVTNYIFRLGKSKTYLKDNELNTFLCFIMNMTMQEAISGM